MRSRGSRRPQGFLLAVTTFAAVNLVVAITASGFVPPTFAGNSTRAITANDLKPAECAALDLTSVRGGAGLVTGSGANELLLGSELADSIEGAGGDDCLVGGPMGDTLTGGAGVDVCLGGGGIDVFVGCETEIQ